MPQQDQSSLFLHNKFSIQDIQGDTWTCVAALEMLLSDMADASSLLQEIKSCDLVDTKSFLRTALDLSERIKTKSRRLTSLCSQNLEKLDRSSTYDNDDDNLPELPPLDPGLRPNRLTDGQKRYLISKGPHQPRLKQFPRNNSIPPTKQRQFSATWYHDYPHLEYSVERDSAFCFVCSLFHTPSSYDAWSNTGVSTWNKMKSTGKDKKGKLSGHFSSTAHGDALKAFASFIDPACHVDTMLDISRRNLAIQEEGDRLESMEIVKILFDVSR